MTFSKSFPWTSENSTYPKWEEISLNDSEEKEVEEKAKKENIKLMKECIDQAKEIIKEKGLKEYQSDVINIAISLFEKIGSHVVYWKESKAKEKFDKKFLKR